MALETVEVPPPDSWLTVRFDEGVPSLEGPERTASQSSVVKLEPTFFASGPSCSASCDPSEFNPVVLTGAVSLQAFARAVSVADITDPARERAPVSAPSLIEQESGHSTTHPWLQSAGFDRQPPARTWRLHLDADLPASDGQILGYPWVGFVENGHELPLVAFEGTV